jgi:putative transposase
MEHTPKTLTKIFIHLVFTTGGRRNFLQVSPLRSRLHEYMCAVLRGLNCGQVVVGGVIDHVHVLFDLDQSKALAEVVRELKKASSQWVKEQEGDNGLFHWGEGYAAFSVSASNVPAVTQYILNQEKHHAKFDWKVEMNTLYEKYGIPHRAE